MRLSVDAALCTGHGRCYALAPGLFAPDDFGHCELVFGDGDVPNGLDHQARLGRDNCPEHAITISG